MNKLNPNLVVDSSNVPKEMISRFADIFSCHRKILDALYAVRRIIELTKIKPTSKVMEDQMSGDIKALWCSFSVNYYSCFNDGMGSNTKRVVKDLNEDEKRFHEEIAKDRNDYFCHTGTHNTSRIFEVGFDELGSPAIGMRLLSKEYAGLGKYIEYEKLANKVRILISMELEACEKAISKKLLVREKNLDDLLRDRIVMKPEAIMKISRVVDYLPL